MFLSQQYLRIDPNYSEPKRAPRRKGNKTSNGRPNRALLASAPPLLDDRLRAQLNTQSETEKTLHKLMANHDKTMANFEKNRESNASANPANKHKLVCSQVC